MNISKLFRYATLTTSAVLLSLCGLVYAGGLTLGHPYGKGSRVDNWAENLSSCINEKLGIPVRILDGERLGEPSELVYSLARGRIDLALLPTSEIVAEWQELSELQFLSLRYNSEITNEPRNNGIILEEFNKSSNQTGIELIDIGWQYGALVTGDARGDAILDLKDLNGKTVAGGDAVMKKAVEYLGGYPVSIEEYHIFSALKEGYIDWAIVDEGALQWGIRNQKFQSIFWAQDFTPIEQPIAIIMNKWNDRTFGGDLAYRISNECQEVTRMYNRESKTGMNRIPQIAKEAGIIVTDIPEDTQMLWVEANKEARFFLTN